MQVVENLVLTMKLPKATRLSLSGHSVLMERSAQLVSGFGSENDNSGSQQTAPSLTTFALADASGSNGEPTEFKERLISSLDDFVLLESELALRRVSVCLRRLL